MTKKSQEKKRNTNIELLRIIAMVMIVCHHYSVHGLADAETMIAGNIRDSKWLASGGMLGVDLFVMISGYYMCQSKLTLQKMLKLWGQVWFYAVGIAFLCMIVDPNTGLDIKTLLFYCLPISHSAYWFVSAYVWLMLLSPLLNIVVRELDIRKMAVVVLTGIVMISLIPLYLGGSSQVGNLGWFGILYLLAAMVRKYQQEHECHSRGHLVLAVVLFLIMQTNTNFQGMTSWLAVWTAMELLIAFSSMKPAYHAVVAWIGSATLGIYLIHDHEMIRSILWDTIIKSRERYTQEYFIFYALGAVLGIMVICTLIDWIRQWSVEKIWLYMMKHWLIGFFEKIATLWKKLSKQLKEAYLDLFRQKKKFWNREQKKFLVLAVLVVLVPFHVLMWYLFPQVSQDGTVWSFLGTQYQAYAGAIVKGILCVYVSLYWNHLFTGNEFGKVKWYRTGIARSVAAIGMTAALMIAYFLLKGKTMEIFQQPNKYLVNGICICILLCFYDKRILLDNCSLDTEQLHFTKKQ